MAEEKGIVEYRSRDGQQIKLSPAIIKRFLVSGNSELVTDQELMLYMGICKSRGLNPFIKDAYLIKYTANDNAAIIVSIDYYRKRARAQADCRGWKCGIVVKNLRDEIEYREGAIMLDGEVLIGGWFEAMPDGWDVPMKKTVNLSRYIKKTKDGRTTRFWSPENQPEMIVKVVEGQGLRATWPDEFQGLYVDAEMQSQDAQAELDQAVKVKSTEAPKEERPISEILGKPETREAAPSTEAYAPFKKPFTKPEPEKGFDAPVDAPTERPYTAPPDPMQTADTGSKARKSAQDAMDAKMESKMSPEMKIAVQFTEKFSSIIKSPFFGEFWKQHCEKVNLSQQEAKVSALSAPDNFFSNFNAYLKSLSGSDAEIHRAETLQESQGDAQSKKTADDTPAPETQNVAQSGPEIRPSLKQIFAKFPARLKITEGYKTIMELAADYPDALLEILIEKPVESLSDLGAVLKAMSVKVDQIETSPKGTFEPDKKVNPDPLFEEPPMPDGPPEW